MACPVVSCSVAICTKAHSGPYHCRVVRHDNLHTSPTVSRYKSIHFDLYIDLVRSVTLLIDHANRTVVSSDSYVVPAEFPFLILVEVGATVFTVFVVPSVDANRHPRSVPNFQTCSHDPISAASLVLVRYVGHRCPV